MRASPVEADRPLEGDTPERTRGARRGLVYLVSAFAAGGLVYLATKSLIAGAVIPSVGAGWESVTTGLWVLRYDPRAGRRRIVFLFYLASACWRAGAAALGAVLGFLFLADRLGRPPDMDRIAATGGVLIGGVILSTLIGAVAITWALRAGLRVWIDPKLPRRLARLQEFGDRPGRNGFNHAVFVVATAVPAPILAALTGVLIALSANGAPAAQAGGDLPALLALLVLVASPIWVMPLYSRVSSRVVAASPFECWPLRAEGEASSEGA